MEETKAKNKDQEDIEKMLFRSELLVKSIGNYIDEAYISWDKFHTKFMTWLKDTGLYDTKEDEIHAVQRDSFIRKRKSGDECGKSINSSDSFEIEMDRLFYSANKTVNHGRLLIGQMQGTNRHIKIINSLINRLNQEKLALQQKQTEEIRALAKILKEKQDEITLLKNSKSLKVFKINQPKVN